MRLLVSDDREPLNVNKVGDIKLDLLPQGINFLTVEAGHINQYVQRFIQMNGAIALGQESFVICLSELAADVDNQNLSAVFFIQLNRLLASFTSF